MKTHYLLQSAKLNGSIGISYLNGVLSSFNLELNQALTEPQLEAICCQLLKGNNEQELLKAFAKIGLVPVKQMGANQKIALFCEYYMKYNNGLKYKASRADGSKIREFKVTDILLTAYFRSQNFLFKGKWSVGNLVKYYNELLLEISMAGKSKHPDYWDKAYEIKLKSEELPDYWRHLRGLGLQPKKDRFDITIDWVKFK